jgi:hypothetical protein
VQELDPKIKDLLAKRTQTRIKTTQCRLFSTIQNFRTKTFLNLNKLLKKHENALKKFEKFKQKNVQNSCKNNGPQASLGPTTLKIKLANPTNLLYKSAN